MRIALAACLTMFTASAATADLFMRVVDTGAGLCCVIRTHNDRFIVYDLGHWNGQGFRAFRGVRGMIPEDAEIDLVVLSHSDSDHLGGAAKVFDRYQVNRVVRSGFERSTGTWGATDDAIDAEPNCEDINLKNDDLPGPIVLDETTVSFVAGWHRPPSAWGLSGGEFRNAGSICVRIEYADKSILLCGDAVGRHLGSHPNVCIATEKHMVDNSDTAPIDSDIIVAPHHGADNGSSTRFIREVDPTWVIFSAGHAHQHPTYSAAKRYMDNGVSRSNIFRTDLGDHEDGPYEWWHGRRQGHVDPPGDDDVDVRIKPNGFITVKYRHDNSLSFSDPAAAPWNQGVPQEVLDAEAVPTDELERQEYGDDYDSGHERMQGVTIAGRTNACVSRTCRPACRSVCRRSTVRCVRVCPPSRCRRSRRCP